VNSYQTYPEGINSPGRLAGNLPSLRKSRPAEATAIVDHARGTVKIECAEFRHGHEIARLIGILDKATLTLGATIGTWISLAP
jgi:hypothetical protein